jgi:tripartite-type tricarboxylate transporter receptor subunit TctC
MVRLCALVLVCVGGNVCAQSWPWKPIRAIVPYTAGGAIDIVSRTVAQQLSVRLGQPIVIESRPGAGGVIGTAAVAKADPDGHTILLTASSHTISPWAYGVSTSKRASALPDVPTTLEAGFANSNYNFWVGMFVPAKTPRDIVDKLHQETVKVLQSPEIQAKLASFGADTMLMKPDEFDVYVKNEIATNEALVKAAGLTAK